MSGPPVPLSSAVFRSTAFARAGNIGGPPADWRKRRRLAPTWGGALLVPPHAPTPRRSPGADPRDGVVRASDRVPVVDRADRHQVVRGRGLDDRGPAWPTVARGGAHRDAEVVHERVHEEAHRVRAVVVVAAAVAEREDVAAGGEHGPADPLPSAA